MIVMQDLAFHHRHVVKKRDRALIHHKIIHMGVSCINKDLIIQLSLEYNYSIFAIVALLQDASLFIDMDNQGDDLLNIEKLDKLYNDIAVNNFKKITYFHDTPKSFKANNSGSSASQNCVLDTTSNIKNQHN